MAPVAKLASVDAVARMAVAVRRFQEEATAALSELEMQVRRGLDWIQHQQKDYWREQVRRGWDEVAAARIALERKAIFRSPDERPSDLFERKLLDQAKRRLEESQRKLEAVRHWSHVIEREAIEYRGALNQLAGGLQVDVPRAAAVLERMGRALEAYLAVQTAAEPSVDWAGLMRLAQGRDDQRSADSTETAAVPVAAAPAPPAAPEQDRPTQGSPTA